MKCTYCGKDIKGKKTVTTYISKGLEVAFCDPDCFMKACKKAKRLIKKMNKEQLARLVNKKKKRQLMKKIYISGKITGDANYRAKFTEEANRLLSFGYEPVNPAALVLTEVSWEDAMKTVLREMLLCEGVSLLPDWVESKGAIIEKRLALELGMDVRDNKNWF